MKRGNVDFSQNRKALRGAPTLCLGVHLTQGDTCDDDSTNCSDSADDLVPTYTSDHIRHRLGGWNLDEFFVSPIAKSRNWRRMWRTSTCDTQLHNTNLCFEVEVRILAPATV